MDREFIASRTVGWDAVEAKARGLAWDALERGSGLARADMFRFAEAFGKAGTAIIVWSMGVTHHRYGSDNVRAIVNLQLARGNVGRPHTGLMPIRGHSGVQGGAEMGALPGSYVMGAPANEENARRFATPEYWGFAPPAWKGLSAAEMVLAAGRGEIDVLWQSGGNFLDTADVYSRWAPGNPGGISEQIIGRWLKERGNRDGLIVATKVRGRMWDGPDGEGLGRAHIMRAVEDSLRRLQIETIDLYQCHSRDENTPIEETLRAFGELISSGKAFPWQNTSDIRAEIDRVCPTYRGIASLRKKGDNFQYGGPRLLADRFLTPDGKGHFTAIDLPDEKIPEGRFLLTTRRGKQFNSIINAGFDPLTGAGRHDILMAAEDARKLGLSAGDPVILRSEVGEFRGRVRVDRIKPGYLQGHWPEVNVLIPAGRLDASGVPDYNAIVELLPAPA